MIIFAAVFDQIICDIGPFQTGAGSVSKFNHIAQRFAKFGRERKTSSSAYGEKRSPEVVDYDSFLNRALWMGQKHNIDVKSVKKKFNALEERKSSEKDSFEQRRRFNLLGGKPEVEIRNADMPCLELYSLKEI